MSRPATTKIPAQHRPELVGMAEAQAILGVSRATIWGWVNALKDFHEERGFWPEDAFPQPLDQLQAGLVWRKADIEHFHERRQAQPRQLRGGQFVSDAEPEPEPVAG